ncbi:hypothetical protein BGZ61DRAFT_374925, partial [Ilyonectria robusta]|uniref:uncharacterized protein n=1 Tax=Ilyonectria robusta TaxID=1079257 RepID=UPI001E8CEEA6
IPIFVDHTVIPAGPILVNEHNQFILQPIVNNQQIQYPACLNYTVIIPFLVEHWKTLTTLPTNPTSPTRLYANP